MAKQSLTANAAASTTSNATKLLPIFQARLRMYEARAIAQAGSNGAPNPFDLFNAIETLLSLPINDLEDYEGVTERELAAAAKRCDQ